jgi:zinc protease
MDKKFLLIKSGVNMSLISYLLPFILLPLQIFNYGEKMKIFPFKINKVSLENGLTVISIPYDSPGIIAYYTFVKAGSRNEVEPGKSGFAHFFEHMMFRGTERFSTDDYNLVLKSIGADGNAYTTDDYTCYHTICSKYSLETIIDIESDRFKNLKYDIEGFKTEANTILGEYNKNYSIPANSLEEKLFDLAFTKHPYKHTTMGFLKDIIDLPNQYEYSLKFFDKYYRPENCYLIVVGDFNQKDLITKVKKSYGDWKPGNHHAEIPIEPEQKSQRSGAIEWKNPTLPYILIGYHVPGFKAEEKDIPVFDIISQMLFSQSAPLYQKLVIEKQLVEYVSGYAISHKDPNLYLILAKIKDESNVNLVKDEIYSAIEEIKKNPIDQKVLNDIKSNLKYSFALNLNTPGNVAESFGFYLQLTDDVDAINKLYETYDTISSVDILNISKKYFNAANRTSVILNQEKKK